MHPVADPVQPQPDQNAHHPAPQGKSLAPGRTEGRFLRPEEPPDLCKLLLPGQGAGTVHQIVDAGADVGQVIVMENFFDDIFSARVDHLAVTLAKERSK